MKKVLVVILSLITSASFAQIRKGNTVIEKTRIGLFGGLSLANQIVSDPYGNAYSDNAKAGGIAGISVIAPISYGWYFQPEITYSNMGTTYSDDQIYSGKKNLNMNYLSVPLLFKYSEPFTGLGILFGPQYGYLLNANIAPTGSFKNNYGKADATSDWKRSDISGVVGLEYYFPNNGTPGPKFGLSARYQFGFLNVNNGGVSDNSRVTNSGFFITAGVRF